MFCVKITKSKRSMDPLDRISLNSFEKDILMVLMYDINC